MDPVCQASLDIHSFIHNRHFFMYSFINYTGIYINPFQMTEWMFNVYLANTFDHI